MNSNNVSLFVNSRPFEPFAFHVVDGRVFEVRQPDFIAMGDYALAIWFLHPAGQLELIDVELISSMRTIGPADPAEFIR